MVALSGSVIITGFIGSSTDLNSSCDVPPDGEFPSCYSTGSWPGVSATDNNGYIMIFNEDNELIYSVTFPGTPQCLGGYSDGNTWESTADFAVGGNIFCDGTTNFPFTAIGFQQDDCSNAVRNGFIMKLRLTGETVTHQYATLMGKADEGTVIESVDIDSERNVFFAGYGDEISTLQAEGDYCSDPDTETMPLCNSTEEAYMETDLLNLYDERTYIGAIDNNFNLVWCTLYGDGVENRPTSIITNEEKLFIVGWSDYNWTLEQFDTTEDSDDYFRNEFSTQEKGPKDGAIARFGIDGIFDTPLTIENEELSTFFVSPNPTNQNISISSADKLTGSLRVMNSTGKVVLYFDQFKVPNNIDVRNLANGMYVLEFRTANKRYLQKFIKQ